MEIEAIGRNVSSTTTNANSSVNQEEFIELFLAQLNYQDPLEPLNNREFLAQLAQFSSLEQTRMSNESLTNLLQMNSSDQAMSLLERNVEVRTNSGGTFVGRVNAVQYTASGINLTVASSDGNFINNVALSQINLVR